MQYSFIYLNYDINNNYFRSKEEFVKELIWLDMRINEPCITLYDEHGGNRVIKESVLKNELLIREKEK